MDQITTVNSALVLTALSILLILTRLFLRRLKHESFVPDDWLMLAGSLFYVGLTATRPTVVWNGTNTAQTAPERLQDDAVARIIVGSKLVLVGRVFYLTYLWCLKGCVLIYLARLKIRADELLAVKVTAALVVGSWLMSFFAIFLECRPFHLYWQVLPHAPECAKAVVDVVLMESANAATIILIMAIPLPFILRTTTSLKAQLQLLALYLLTLFLIFISVFRLLDVLNNVTQNRVLWAQIRRFNDRLRQSLEKLEIETRVDIIQRSGTGEMTPSPSDDRMEEFFGGSRAGARTARISTSISTADKKPLPIGPRYVLAKLHGSEACG
ncbi:ubiD family decarboxylase [Diplocarpon rosae]|nr:ubiD family decarboxylase [Diplocarpon rosae]